MNLEEFAGLVPEEEEPATSTATANLSVTNDDGTTSSVTVVYDENDDEALADAIVMLAQPEPIVQRHTAGAAQRRGAVAKKGLSTDYVTPPQYVKAAQEAMGSIDLDPASSHRAWKIAQEAGAHITDIFTPDDEDGSGLTRNWHGNVFLNPPGGWVIDPNTKKRVPGQPMWIQKAIEEVAAGRVDQVVILLHADSIRLPMIHPYPICFTDHRIKFLSEDGSSNPSPTNQNIFVYMGQRVEEFIQAFDPFGVIMTELI